MKTSHKTRIGILTAAAIAAGLFLIGCGGQQPTSPMEHDHDHDHDHDHAHADADHDHDHDHDHAGMEEHGHTHAKKTPGPNGGRLITLVEPHAEFFVTPEHTVKITFVGDDNQAVDPTSQTVSLVGGDRANPTKLAFTREGQGLISEGALPEGDGYPIVLEIKAHDQATPIMARFNLEMARCPSCDYAEYACICDH